MAAAPTPRLLFWSLGAGWGELLPRKNTALLWELSRASGEGQEPPLSLPEQGRALGLLALIWSTAPAPTSGATASVTCPPPGNGEQALRVLGRGHSATSPSASRPSSRPPGARGPSPPSPPLPGDPGASGVWLPWWHHVFVAEQVAFPGHVRGTGREPGSILSLIPALSYEAADSQAVQLTDEAAGSQGEQPQGHSPGWGVVQAARPMPARLLPSPLGPGPPRLLTPACGLPLRGSHRLG